ATFNLESLYVRNLITRGDKRTERGETVEALSTHPLTIAELQITGAHVINWRVTKNIIERITLADGGRTPSNNYRELRLVVDLSAYLMQHNRSIVRAQRVGQLIKDQRRRWRFGASLDGVVDVIASDCDDFARINWRQE